MLTLCSIEGGSSELEINRWLIGLCTEARAQEEKEIEGSKGMLRLTKLRVAEGAFIDGIGL